MSSQDVPTGLNLSADDQKELQTFMNQQQAQARVQSAVHKFTDVCWDKCVTGTPSTAFSRWEQGCIANCVERFLDTSLFMVRRIEKDRLGSGPSL